MNAILFEDKPHAIIASDLSAVRRVLKFVGFDILPDSFHSLWTGQLFRSVNNHHTEFDMELTATSPPKSSDKAGDRLRGF